MRLKKEFADHLEKAMQELRAIGLDPSPPQITMSTTPVTAIGKASPVHYVTIFGISIVSAIPERWLELES